MPTMSQLGYVWGTLLSLRLLGEIDWSWTMLLSPLWVAPLLFILAYLVCQIGGVLTGRYV
jgi:hypothetical protein